MQFDWWTFLLQVINVLVLIWLLNHFLYRPITAIIAKRKAETAKLLEDTQQARKAAQEAQAEARAQAAKTAAERLAVLEAAKSAAAGQAKAILAQADVEAAKRVAEAMQSAQRSLLQVRALEDRKSTRLAVAISQKLMASLPQDARVAGYPERLETAIGKLDDEQKAAIFSRGSAIRIVSARALTKAEIAAVRAVIKTAAGKSVPLSFVTDPGLVAGLELRSRHGVIHNSLKSDLAHIREALEDNDKN